MGERLDGVAGQAEAEELPPHIPSFLPPFPRSVRQSLTRPHVKQQQAYLPRHLQAAGREVMGYNLKIVFHMLQR